MKLGLAGQAANPKWARRRRFWSSDEKRRMVAESFTPGASVSKVAPRYGVNANLLFTWRRRREARSATNGGAEPLALVPVRVVLAAGDRILVGADVDAAALARVVKALSRR